MSNVLFGIIGFTLAFVVTAVVIALSVEQTDGPRSISATLLSEALCRFVIRPPAGWAAT